MAWAVMAKADGRHVPGLAATERRRLSEKLSILAERVGTEDASVILTAWVRNRGRRVVLHSSDVRSLEVDPRVWASGVSDARAKIAAVGVFEGYFTEDDLESVRRDHLLRAPSDTPNVYFHVVGRMSARRSRDLPWLRTSWNMPGHAKRVRLRTSARKSSRDRATAAGRRPRATTRDCQRTWGLARRRVVVTKSSGKWVSSGPANGSVQVVSLTPPS